MQCIFQQAVLLSQISPRADCFQNEAQAGFVTDFLQILGIQGVVPRKCVPLMSGVGGLISTTSVSCQN
eukprot:scaffold833_cov92-Cylindrotheca_fusiformis.AAC.5